VHLHYCIIIKPHLAEHQTNIKQEIEAMKSEGGSSNSGEIINEDLGEINEEQ